MGLKSVMLRTCGLTSEEFHGRTAHDIADFAMRLQEAKAITEEQKRDQQVPATQKDLAWLKQAYLKARYPNASAAKVPSKGYTREDAQQAIQIATHVLRWAAHVEDLPEPARRAGLDEFKAGLEDPEDIEQELAEDHVEEDPYLTAPAPLPRRRVALASASNAPEPLTPPPVRGGAALNMNDIPAPPPLVGRPVKRARIALPETA